MNKQNMKVTESVDISDDYEKLFSRKPSQQT
jgi:hypothetical protein